MAAGAAFSLKPAARKLLIAPWRLGRILTRRKRLTSSAAPMMPPRWVPVYQLPAQLLAPAQAVSTAMSPNLWSFRVDPSEIERTPRVSVCSETRRLRNCSILAMLWQIVNREVIERRGSRKAETGATDIFVFEFPAGSRDEVPCLQEDAVVSIVPSDTEPD
jgi:hypothetical protein